MKWQIPECNNSPVTTSSVKECKWCEFGGSCDFITDEAFKIIGEWTRLVIDLEKMYFQQYYGDILVRSYGHGYFVNYFAAVEAERMFPVYKTEMECLTAWLENLECCLEVGADDINHVHAWLAKHGVEIGKI